MRILYIITKIVTYPGAFLKAFWEHITCRLLGIPVIDRNYFAPNLHFGHANHLPAQTPGRTFLLAFMPLVAQRILGLIFLGAAAPPILLFGVRGAGDSYLFWVYVIGLFLGLSLMCNAFPQWDSAKHQWQLFYGKAAKASLAGKILLAPLNAWLVAGAWLEKCGIPVISSLAAVIVILVLQY